MNLLNTWREWRVSRIDMEMFKLQMLLAGLDENVWPDEVDRCIDSLSRLEETRSAIVKKCKPIYEGDA